MGDTLTDKPKGTGLGLPICKEIVEHHNRGKIWVESELGEGSRLAFNLPLALSKEKHVTLKTIDRKRLIKQLRKQLEDTEISIPSGKKNISLVDNEQHIQNLLRQQLEEKGYHAREAIDETDVLKKVKAEKPDMITIDSFLADHHDIVQTIKFRKGLENICYILLGKKQQ